MKAMQITEITRVDQNPKPLKMVDLPVPQPGEGEILIQVAACSVCHTELDEIEGRTPPPHLPVIPGHQVVGRVVELGPGVDQVRLGERVGLAWIFSACGRCEYCLSGNENLCANFRATGRDADGGYVQFMRARQDFVYPIPELFSDAEAAPLLCAGAVGYRALKLANLTDGQILGLTGFGASGHLVLKMVQKRFPHSKIFVYSRSPQEQEFARQLGAAWAGEIGEHAPEKLNSIIDTTPAWKPVVGALGELAPGGRLVINAIRKEEFDKDALLKLDYSRDLWMEKEIKSVANVTRSDVCEFLKLAAEIPIRPEVQLYKLEQANQALVEMKNRQIRGAKVLLI